MQAKAEKEADLLLQTLVNVKDRTAGLQDVYSLSEIAVDAEKLYRHLDGGQGQACHLLTLEEFSLLFQSLDAAAQVARDLGISDPKYAHEEEARGTERLQLLLADHRPRAFRTLYLN